MNTPLKDKVEILPYDPEWPERFEQLGSDLRDALGNVALRIDHIGSTAILDLAAKPIIDIQISVAAFDPAEAYQAPLEKLDYVLQSDNGDRSKRNFREAPGTRRTHIHVKRAGSWSEQSSLLFRDYLRCHKDHASAYASVKRQLAGKYGRSRIGYTEARTEIIWDIMNRADRWSQSTGWEPGPSDA